jgi:hypothetical protein
MRWTNMKTKKAEYQILVSSNVAEQLTNIRSDNDRPSVWYNHIPTEELATAECMRLRKQYGVMAYVEKM